MDYRLEARLATTHEEDGVTVIGFAEGTDTDPGRYVLLQWTHEPDEQDIALSHDRIHLTVEDQARGIYGGIERITMGEDRIVLHLDAEGRAATEVEGDVVIGTTDADADEARATLRRLAAEAGVLVEG